LRLAENSIDFLVWKQYLWNKPKKKDFNSKTVTVLQGNTPQTSWFHSAIDWGCRGH